MSYEVRPRTVFDVIDLEKEQAGFPGVEAATSTFHTADEAAAEKARLDELVANAQVEA